MSDDPRDRQPYRPVNPKDSHRVYIPASWSPPGEGGGHPKLDGGQTIDTRSGAAAPRGFNRPNQRYQLTPTEAQARRTLRANDEYDATLVLQGDRGLVEVRSPSGNNYDISHDLLRCDCPDWIKLHQSYVVDVKCKHRLIAERAIADVGGYANLDWSCDRLAEELGLDRRTVEALCEEGFFDAEQIHRVWVIPGGGTLPARIAAYQDKIIGDPAATQTALVDTGIIVEEV